MTGRRPDVRRCAPGVGKRGTVRELAQLKDQRLLRHRDTQARLRVTTHKSGGSLHLGGNDDSTAQAIVTCAR